MTCFLIYNTIPNNVSIFVKLGPASWCTLFTYWCICLSSQVNAKVDQNPPHETEEKRMDIFNLTSLGFQASCPLLHTESGSANASHISCLALLPTYFNCTTSSWRVRTYATEDDLNHGGGLNHQARITHPADTLFQYAPYAEVLSREHRHWKTASANW